MRRLAYAILAIGLVVGCKSPTSGGGNTSAATWQSVGNPAISEGTVKYVAMALDSSGNPYVGYSDYGTTAAMRANVIHYTGSSWVSVGAKNFSAGEADDVSLVLDSSGAPYVAYYDTSLSKGVCMKYNGTSWTQLADPPLQGSSTDGPTFGLAADGSGNVYWVLGDYATGGRGLSLFKLNGSNWNFVASTTFNLSGDTGSFEIVLDRNGVPYFAMEAGTSQTLAVYSLSGSTMTAVASTGLPSGAVNFPTLAFDSSNTPYLSYEDMSTAGANKVNVLKLSGTSWVQAGNADFSPDACYGPVIGCYGSTPYVAYSDKLNFMNQHLYIEKLSGSTWTQVTNTGFSQAEGSPWHQIAFNAAGTPFVSYLDNTKYVAGVIKYQ